MLTFRRTVRRRAPRVRAVSVSGVLLLPQVTEEHFLRDVTALAVRFGWRPYHTHDSRKSQPGFPDLTLVRPPRLIFAELKTMTGVVTTEQEEWLDDLWQVPGVEAYLWRPSDLETITRCLNRR
jgi:hypothetical protein